MKTILRTLLCIFLCAALLTGCTISPLPPQTEPATSPTTAPTDPTAAPTVPATEPAELPTEPATEPPTEPPETLPPHSALYIPGLEVEDVITYFNEVCLDAEFVNSGNATLLQKWNTPIICSLNGEYTAEDYDTLMRLFDWLNNVEGFPGISLSEHDYEVNLRIYFCTQEKMINLLGDNFYNCDGGVTFWYDGYNQIYNATICYRTDLNQHLRNSVILEEIYNGLGPVQDTNLRPDSIIYAEFTQPQALTEVDELILKLLYHPDMKCGMNAAQCEAVIRQLYY